MCCIAVVAVADSCLLVTVPLVLVWAVTLQMLSVLVVGHPRLLSNLSDCWRLLSLHFL